MGKGIIVCVDPRAAEAGARVLEAGGNAFDAAVAVAFTQAVVLPFSCGLGGFMSANLWAAGTGEQRIIDGCLRAGAGVSADMWAADHRGEAAFSGSSQFDDHRSEYGYTSICTPGTVAALSTVFDGYCTMPWTDLLQPAIDIARKGYPVVPGVRANVELKTGDPYHVDGLTRLNATPDCARIFLPGGAFREDGELIRNDDYARTLEQLATAGADDFYRGDLAATMARDFQENGSFVTAADLNGYRSNSYAAVTSTYLNYRIGTNNAPGAGPLLLQALNVLEDLPVGEQVHGGAEHLSLLAHTLQLVNQDRREFLGDPEVIGSKPVHTLISKARAEQLRRIVLDGDLGAEPPAAAEADTTHLTVVDGDGNIAAITHSNGNYSGVVTPGLGFIYNNGMNRFDPRPGHPSSLAPGKQRLHLMMPAIVFDKERPVMALGAPGGNVILSALVQSFLNVVEYGMGAVEAVYAPRIHAECSTIWCEARIRTDVCGRLRERGFEVVHQPGPLSNNMARAQLVLIGPDGQLDGGSDPRSGSAVMYV
jgi:gamma-glutamyltranspeptidase/glutathione hydrolase